MTAVISVAALIGVTAWRTVSFVQAKASSVTYVASAEEFPANPNDALSLQEMILLGLATSTNPSALSAEDPITLIAPQVMAQLAGQYGGLLDAGAYTAESALLATEEIAKNMKGTVSYKTYVPEEIKTDEETSYKRMLKYKEDLKVAFAPLLKNNSDEFDLFAAYIEHKDPLYIERLHSAVENYRAAIELTAHVVVPKDAVGYHIAVLNSMQEFAATIDALATHADDPLGSTALVRTYNSAEQHVYYAFNDLGVYYRKKHHDETCVHYWCFSRITRHPDAVLFSATRTVPVQATGYLRLRRRRIRKQCRCPRRDSRSVRTGQRRRRHHQYVSTDL